jgi:hypothetical protein
MNVMHPSSKAGGLRLRWRVLVRTDGRLDPSRPSRPLAWHLATCVDVTAQDKHCPEGHRLLDEGADPDGHCMLEDICPRCVEIARKAW